MITEVLAFASLLYLGGYPVFRYFFRQATLFEAFFLPQVLGLVVVPLLLMLLLPILQMGTALLLLVPALLAIDALITLKWKPEFGRVDRTDVFFAAVMVLCLLSLSLINGTQDVANVNNDNSWQAAAASNIKNSGIFPPELSCFTGAAMLYPWGPSSFLAALSYMTGTNALNLMMWLAPYLFFLAVSSAYVTGRRVAGNAGGGLMVASVFAAATLKLPVPAGFSQNYVFPLVFLGALLMHAYAKTGDRRPLLAAGFVAAGMAYLHAITFLFMTIAAFSLVLYVTVFDTKKLKDMAFLLVPYVVTVPYFTLFGGLEAGMFMFEPLAVMVEYPFLQTFVPLLASIGGAFLLCRNVDFDKGTDVLIATVIAAVLFSSAFIMTWSGNVFRVLDFAYYYLIIIAAFVISRLKDAWKAVIALGLVVSALVLVNVSPLLSFDDITSHPEEVTEAKAVASWMKGSTPESSVFLISPDQATDSAIYIALAERRAPLCNDMAVPTFFINPRERMEDVILMYTEPTRDVYQKDGVDYVLLCSKERRFFDRYDLVPFGFDSSVAFTPVYANGNCTVYSINKSLLPEREAVGARASLNFTLYSRWYQTV